MRTQIASRLTRLEKSAGTGSRRLVVVERATIMRGIGRSELGVPGGSTKPTSRSRAGGQICLV
jgi:hypothetical protein